VSFEFEHSRIDSYVGDIVPLRTNGKGSVKYKIIGDAANLREFDEGVLVVLKSPGNAVLRAECDGEVCECEVSVRDIRHEESGPDFEYFVGDLHDHTTMIHKAADFRDRTQNLPRDYVEWVKAEDHLDFAVISDHAGIMCDRNFFDGFTTAEDALPMKTVIFPGSEAEIQYTEPDRFGITRRESGEIVVINADNYKHADTWEEFLEAFENSPAPIATLAHPQISGYSTPGLWNFRLEKRHYPLFMHMLRMVEMGNGSDRESNLINEYVYSSALDNGFCVSTTCSSDSHGRPWGRHPGKTVIMAKERSREAFVDAMRSNRVYACESGNVKLKWSINGRYAPCTLDLTDKYEIKVSLSYFADDPSTEPVCCQVITDCGITAAEADCTGSAEFVINLTSDTARYFYLRLIDAQGRKTWSPPIFTGRKFDDIPTDSPTPIDPSEFTAADEETGIDAHTIVDNDPNTVWTNDRQTASIVIDMGKHHTVSAIGHLAPPVLKSQLKPLGIPDSEVIRRFVSRFRLSSSTDGQNYTVVLNGVMRNFGGEEILRFDGHKARYLKFEALSNVGMESRLEKHISDSTAISLITVYGR